jgi:uncharacterized protein (TIGR03032 family)
VARRTIPEVADAPPGNRKSLTLAASTGLAGWLEQADVSLVFALPPNKLVFVGRDDAGRLAVHERTFDKAMGLAADGTDRIWVATRTHLWRLDHEPGSNSGTGDDDGADRRFVPRRAVTTGYLNAHDLTVDAAGEVTFVATRFACLARPSDERSFVPTWRPPWLAGVPFGPGDRCHLNGVATDGTGPAYVSSVSDTVDIESWRDHRAGGGVVVHVPSGQRVCGGLSMPHSPRLDADGGLWLTNSGTGHVCRVDVDAGTWEAVCWAPGFLRGLTFHGEWAVAGSSLPREGSIYGGLGIDEELSTRGLKPRLGLFVFHVPTGRVIEWLFVEGAAREVYDVTVLPAVRQPSAIGLVGPELRDQIPLAPV